MVKEMVTTRTIPQSMTADEWAALPEDIPGELVNGALVAEEMPDFVHENVVAWLVAVLRAWLRPKGGWVAGSNAKLTLSADKGRMPDVIAYFPNRRPEPRGPIRIPPDIAVEVVSRAPSDVRRDRVTKLGEYAAFGISQYWIVDPQLRTFEILMRGADSLYVHMRSAESGVLDEIPGCEGLVLDLDAFMGGARRTRRTRRLSRSLYTDTGHDVGAGALR